MKFPGWRTTSILPLPPQHRSIGWRRRSTLALLLLVLIGACAYQYLTAEGRLIPIARGFLEGMTGGEVTIRHMRFSFFRGIDLTHVVIRTPKRFDFGPQEGPGRVVFEVADLHLDHDPLSLLVGRFDIKRVIAVRPRFQIVRQKSTGLNSWQAMLSNRKTGKEDKRQQWPVIQLRECTLRSGATDGETVSFASPIELDVQAEPVSGQPGRYTCRLQPFGQDRLVRALDVNIPQGRIRGNLPGIWISQLLPSLPAQYARWCDILELAGEISAQSIHFDSGAKGKCTLNLSQVSLSVPEDESEFYGAKARARRLVRLTNVAGQITFEPATIAFEISGQLSGAPCHLWGRFDGYTGPAGEIGYEVHIDARHIAIPDRRDPYVADQVNRLPRKVYKYFEQFDPTAGWVGIQGCVTRPAGPDQRTKFRGVVTTDDAAGYYDDFPYRGKHARSVIRCTDEGIFFTVIARRDPESLFRIEGWVADGSPWTDAEVRVQGIGIPLDGDMIDALPPKFQQLLSHFDLYGQINCDFHLERRGGTPETGAAPWRWWTRITMRDVAGRYHPFPYMQHGIRGTLEAADGILNKIDLYAVDLQGTTVAKGKADLRDDHTAVDIHVRTYDRPLTSDVLDALPQAAGRAIRQTGLTGLMDVDATLTMSDKSDGELECRADVNWKHGTIAPRQIPYPFSDVQGHIYVDLPGNRIDIRQVQGHSGSAAMQLTGTIHTGPEVSSHIEASLDDLPLSPQLHDALPATLQHWWQEFQPEGSLDVRSTIDTVGDANQPTVSHRTTILLKNNRVCWDAFPLPLEGVTGTILLTDRHCELKDIRAAHGTGRIHGSCRIDWSDQSAGTQAVTAITARHMPLDESLREAVPWQLRKMWNDWQPAGRINLDLNRLTCKIDKSGGAVWDLEGAIDANLSKLTTAVDITDAAVKAGGTLHIDQARNVFTGRGTLRAGHAIVSMIPITAAKGDWIKKQDGEIRLNDLQARSLGGVVAGFIEVVPTIQGDRYGVVLTLDRGDPAQLAQVLTGGQMDVIGTIETQIRMQGLSGQPDTRNGSVVLRMEGQGLYRLPGLLQLAGALQIPIRSDASQPEAQQVSARLTLMADKAVLDSLELHDHSFLMQGTGLIDLSTRQADVTVIAARPRVWPNVPLFSELLEGTIRELIEVHATGPVNHLKFEARGLRSLQAALDVLSSRQKHPKPSQIVIPDEIEWRQPQAGEQQ